MLSSFCVRGARVFAGCSLVLMLVATAHAGDVVLVEEHWELHVASTDSNSTAPQVATVFSPTGDVECVHAIFELNHKSVPDFSSGGLHLQLWEGEVPMETRHFSNEGVMSGGSEVVTWTQTMKLDGTTLLFSVDDGTSTTWNHFGGQGHLKTSTTTSLSNLNGYDPDVSVKHSGVTYAGNRVTKLVLKKVRIVGSNGQEYVDDTSRVVHEN